MLVGGSKNLSKYDEYWVLRNSMLGFSKKDISLAISNKNINLKVEQILRKYKINNKSKRKRPYSYSVYDEYWIARQYLLGFDTKDIAETIGISKYTVYKILYNTHFMIKEKINYGITEIAKELGISKQAVHQKVKLCRSPYIKYKLGRKKKNNKEDKYA